MAINSLQRWTGVKKQKEGTYQIKENSAGNIASTGSFVEVDIDTLQLEVALTIILQTWKTTQKTDKMSGGSNQAGGNLQAWFLLWAWKLKALK